ncbi:transposase [Corynebacterium macginleyi]|uniref:transposase n=1 Tax=Corynebacterium macginleyi TaxID=38290 RepID=UPI00190980B8|nr:transposase [Corynebacterium macginleyi]MBK4138647.1 transposase [Corynebacterium macginleyi]
MSRYSEQFKRDGVALYENNEDLSLNSASAELGINRASLHSWVKKYGTGKRARIKAVHDKAQAGECLMVCVWVPNPHEEMDQNDYYGETRSGR